MRIKIFTVHHFVPEHWVANDLYVPFVHGQTIGSHPVLLSDEKGDSLPDRDSYAEMQTQYYVWKNLLADCDYVGFQHYRRYFFFDQIAALAANPICAILRQHILKDPRVFSIDLNADIFDAYRGLMQQCGEAAIEEIRQFIGRHDLLTVRPFSTQMAEQYKASHVPADWDVLARQLPQHSCFRDKPQNLALDLKMLYPYNMYIMSAVEFDKYMTFWFEAITEFAREIKPHDDPYQKRVYGFLSERLFTMYLYSRRLEQPTLRFGELVTVNCSVKQGTS